MKTKEDKNKDEMKKTDDFEILDNLRRNRRKNKGLVDRADRSTYRGKRVLYQESRQPHRNRICQV